MPTMTELPVNDTNSSNQVSSTPIVSTIGKSGRLFGPDQDGIFKSIGSDLLDEGSGIMQMLADKGIMRHGYNNIVDEHDHNYTVAKLSSNPKYFIVHAFLKKFNSGVYPGKIISRSKQKEYPGNLQFDCSHRNSNAVNVQQPTEFWD